MEDSKKPAYTKGYGEAKEENMTKAEQERRDVGLSPEEVGKINRYRSLQGDAFKKRVRRAANVLAAGITAAGVGLFFLIWEGRFAKITPVNIGLSCQEVAGKKFLRLWRLLVRETPA